MMSPSASSPNLLPSSPIIDPAPSSPPPDSQQPSSEAEPLQTQPSDQEQPPQESIDTNTQLDPSGSVTADHDTEMNDANVSNGDDAADAPAENAIDAAQEKDAITGTAEAEPNGAEVDVAAAAQAQRPELRIPQKKDVTLREFLGKMDDYAPIIPDAVTNYYLTLAGLPPPPQTPPHLARLLALAAQKFISDVAADAYQFARIRTGHTTSNTAAANAAAGIGAGMPGMSAMDAVAAAGGPGAAGAKGKEGEKGGKGVQLGVQRPGFGGGGQGGQGQGRTVLTMEDLGMAVGEYGVNVKRGEFYR